MNKNTHEILAKTELSTSEQVVRNLGLNGFEGRFRKHGSTPMHRTRQLQMSTPEIERDRTHDPRPAMVKDRVLPNKDVLEDGEGESRAKQFATGLIVGGIATLGMYPLMTEGTDKGLDIIEQSVEDHRAANPIEPMANPAATVIEDEVPPKP